MVILKYSILSVHAQASSGVGIPRDSSSTKVCSVHQADHVQESQRQDQSTIDAPYDGFLFLQCEGGDTAIRRELEDVTLDMILESCLLTIQYFLFRHDCDPVRFFELDRLILLTELRCQNRKRGCSNLVREIKHSGLQDLR